MGDDSEEEVVCSDPQDTPNDAVPERDPMEVTKCMYHKRIEGKHEGTDSNGHSGCPWSRASSQYRKTQDEEASQKKAAKVQLNKYGDHTNEPRDHDKDWNLGVWRVS